MKSTSDPDLITSRPDSAGVLDRAIAAHLTAFGRAPTLAGIAPGRVNLIGEHTDYSGGFCLPIAIDRWTVAALSPSAGTHTRVFAADLAEQANLEAAAPMDPATIRAAMPSWVPYVAGVLDHFRPAPSFDITITSSVPRGSGLSSSAALETATAAVLAAALGINLTPEQLAAIGRRAEHTFADVPCGIMDQLASSLGRAGHALLIDCAAKTTRPIPLPADAAFIVVNSNVRHALPDGAYEAKVRACGLAAAAFGISTLREVTEELITTRGSTLDDEARRAGMHVVAENARTLRVAKNLEAAASGQLPVAEALARIGWLMFESHASLRDTYQVSCKELDTLVEIASLQPGVHGARMTGAGFGGCIVALVAPAAVESFSAAIQFAYKARTGQDCTIELVQPSSGATTVTLA